MKESTRQFYGSSAVLRNVSYNCKYAAKHKKWYFFFNRPPI